MELGILRLLSKQLDPLTGKLSNTNGAAKVVYLAPLRALVQEKYKDWQSRYSALGVNCVELTGDSDMELHVLDAADIICTTPEKFDSATRKLNEGGGARFFGEIGLVLIDEVMWAAVAPAQVHLLGEPGRGAALEAGVVSRIKMVSRWSTMQHLPIASVRFLAVSATIPNIADIAVWLGAPIPEGLRVYGEEMRPCKLTTVVRSYADSKNDFLFEGRLNQHVAPLIMEFSGQKPTLVFCA
ncbi:helicase ATP-binding domain-containing protein [Haematococcus lacustris]|uniref:Helicase ATP-binding domain-containing protein n=1 Tax=Haematococcus lacustris TaxID=44745 RepID=A0A699YTB3_HAELA|nr:helicase ATP-binding domain-containing protein [Haematococcus lacustris]